MDFLVKNNVIKKNKVFVEIGEDRTKILGVRYAGGKVSITGSFATLTEGDFDVRELAHTVSGCLYRTKLVKNGDIVLCLPSGMIQYRVESAKNTKMADLDKYIRENNQLNKVSEQTHIIDWSYLGEREENGDTMRYYMVAAVSKAVVLPIIQEFSKYRLNVTGITFTENNMVCLSDLWRSDYEHINKLYIDFGSETTRVLVESGGTIVYARVIDAGLFTKTPNSLFQNEIVRIIRMCDNDGIEISKIICASHAPDGLLDDFSDSDIAVEFADCGTWNEIGGDGYLLSLVNADLETDYSLIVGASLATMQKHRRLNLLPSEFSEKQTAKFLNLATGGSALALLVFMTVTFVNLGMAKYTLNKLQMEDSEYNRKVASLTSLEESNKNNKEFIAEYERSNFPFYKFMQFLDYNKPFGLTIISVDSVDRLSPKTEVSEGETVPEPTISYTKDLAGEKISIRGYSQDSVDISLFLHDLANLPYINEVDLKAIEENTLGGENVVLFEAILTLGGAVSGNLRLYNITSLRPTNRLPESPRKFLRPTWLGARRF